ncbi:NUDIX hydrolase [Paenibacillus ginsengarvi]|uniref:8-oxo-dGTP diphosphatase n=1 Tax=Paenibacillus ginsengarvi TaxID=400777 RepID=A0A3B0CK49_9BACL|nr:8-oxo-dGTP diphosphatase [Paenibacillus ginsengarvi]RKN84914.1 8-oxo-dGTP diphosphatase [Paenibacillus ginsengarvi]
MYKYTLCFIRRNNELLLLNRLKRPNMGRWNGIGGKFEPGETPFECVVRETREETGIVLDQAKLAGTVTWITNKTTSGMYVFIADVPASFVFETPVKVDEGILDWKRLDWILHPDNGGMADNVAQFLPTMLSGDLYDHRYTFDENERIIGYTAVPLQTGAPLQIL